MTKSPNLLDSVLSETIPMKGRMIHSVRNGKFVGESQPYDVHGRVRICCHRQQNVFVTDLEKFIRAVDRAGLNKRLLDELDSMPNVKLHFNHKLTGADFRTNKAWIERKRTSSDPPSVAKDDSAGRDLEFEVPFDLMIGADGAHSAVRYHLMKFTRMSYHQEYIDTLWCEFHVPPTENGGFRLNPNHLHIWPGKEFMFIAIASLDNTFTSTLFLPASRFAELDADPGLIVPFFRKYFPGVVPDLIREEDLRTQYSMNPHLPLISIKCGPYHCGASAVIVGDAAHAMVPFYGQGMNAGLEDVRVLFDHLDAFPSDSEGREKALSLYTSHRRPDAHAINELALHNYTEMRSDVTSPLYRARKWLEERLDAYLPNLGWATQYARVSFTNERYSEVERRAARQGYVLTVIAGLVGVTGVCAFGTMGVNAIRRRVFGL